MRKTIGISLIIMVFVIIFIGIAISIGLKDTIITFIIAIALISMIALGTYLITEK